MDDDSLCRMVADSIDHVDASEDTAGALRLIAAKLFPMIGLESTPETRRAFSAGIGLSAARNTLLRVWAKSDAVRSTKH